MKKKLKKEGFQADQLPPTDADRPAVIRMSDVPSMNREEALDTLLDESTKYLNKPTVMNSLPKPKSLIALDQQEMPKYFGAEPFTNPSEDTLSPFIRSTTNPNGYMLENDFAKSFEEKGYEKASGIDMPVPELRHRWKSLSTDRIESSYIDRELKPKSSQFSGMDVGDLNGLKKKIDELMARIDDLENRASGANPQLEVLTFIMTGLFLMFMVDLAVRKSGNMRMVNVR